MKQESEKATKERTQKERRTDRRKQQKAMAHRRSTGSKLLMTVAYMLVMCRAVPINDLLDRASQYSDKLHSLSTMLNQELESHFSPIGRVIMDRPAMCHTSGLNTPNDKEQALQVPDTALMSLARSLLQAWTEPLVVLSHNANTLPHPARNSISSKIQELQDNSKILGDGLVTLSGKMGPGAQDIYPQRYEGGTDLGQDRTTKLTKFYFLLQCLRRDTHKIDSFLKVLRCREAKMQPDLC